MGGASRAGAELAFLPGGGNADHESSSSNASPPRSRRSTIPDAAHRAGSRFARSGGDAASDGADIAAQPVGTSGISTAPRDKSVSLPGAERISSRSGVFRGGRA